MTELLRSNAWLGDSPVEGETAPDLENWALEDRVQELESTLAPPPLKDPAKWESAEVGWGIILPHKPELQARELAGAGDAPNAIRELLSSRPGSPVFRYQAQADRRYTHLRRYYEDGTAQDIALSGSEYGTGRGKLPLYLLICGRPDQIPWQFQYVLSSSRHVGRLDLHHDALENYVDHLINDWSGSNLRREASVVWAVDLGGDDITGLMRRAIAEPLANAFAADAHMGSAARYIDGSHTAATCATLLEALEVRPGMVVTTSHGLTGPLGDMAALRANLGLLVDGDGAALDPDKVLGNWQPDGAIWYAHACCSAGSLDESNFDGLVEEGSPIDMMLQGVAALGSTTSPLPTALLGADKPLKAFVGHVEPTFNWTLADPGTGQRLTSSTVKALYNRLYQPLPLGLALSENYALVGSLLAAWDQVMEDYNAGAGDIGVALRLLLAARDRQSMVIVGDPVVALPALTGMRS